MTQFVNSSSSSRISTHFGIRYKDEFNILKEVNPAINILIYNKKIYIWYSVSSFIFLSYKNIFNCHFELVNIYNSILTIDIFFKQIFKIALCTTINYNFLEMFSALGTQAFLGYFDIL